MTCRAAMVGLQTRCDWETTTFFSPEDQGQIWQPCRNKTPARMTTNGPLLLPPSCVKSCPDPQWLWCGCESVLTSQTAKRSREEVPFVPHWMAGLRQGLQAEEWMMSCSLLTRAHAHTHVPALEKAQEGRGGGR